MEEGIMKPILLTLLYYSVLSKYETGTDAPIHKEVPARQPSVSALS